jgi:hypothetical protein
MILDALFPLKGKALMSAADSTPGSAATYDTTFS